MKFSTLIASAARTLAPLCLCAISQADVVYVDASGNGQFTAIQPAIDAALDGDVLLVRTGSYAAFTIDNRRLSVIADAGAQAIVNGTVVVRNTATDGVVLIAGLEIKAAPGWQQAKGLDIASNSGHVRVQDCTVRGGEGATGVQSAAGGNGASITGSSKVAFANCSLIGGNGGGIPLFVSLGGNGGHGVVEQGSSVAFYDCVLQGGVGGAADYISPNERAGDGGDGCQVLDFGILASGCQFQGGMGGSDASIPGNGGDGLVVNAGQAQLIGNTYAGGMGGWGYNGNFGASGLPQSGPGVFNTTAGLARKLSAPALAAENGTLQVDLTGEPGDRFWLMQSALPGFTFIPSNAGILLVSVPVFSTSRPHATLPASGAASVVLPMPEVGVGVPMTRQYWQSVVVSASGQVRLSSPLHVTVLNCSDLLPDCNGNLSCDSCDLLLPTAVDCDKNGVPDECQPDCNTNGLADACDIANGTSVDSNHNGIPDECEPQTTWYVDANAGPGGNGSAGAPFQALGPAFTRAINGDSVLVADGLYQGSANRNLDFGGRDLIVESQSGAANCIIDCQQQGRAFFVGTGTPASARIQGFTIRNGWATVQSNIFGGGIYIEHSSPTVSGCVFESCVASAGGGGLGVQYSGALIQGCSFVGNTCLGSQSEGGGLLVKFGNFAQIVDCAFVNNQAARGAGLTASQLSVFIERCLFHSNTSTLTGGAIYGYYSDTFLDQCWIAGNASALGGGIAGTGSSWHLTGSTIVDNHATQRAGAAYFSQQSAQVRTWRNSIFWNNTSPAGTAIEVQASPLDIAWCDLQGGQASITLTATGSVIWGPGNLDLDPAFVDRDGPDNNPSTVGDNDYRLSLSSPCLDAGENASVPPDWFDLDGDGNALEPLPFDFDGNARFVEIPGAPNTGSGVSPIVDLGTWERP